VPFYRRYLGEAAVDDEYDRRPPVQFAVRGTTETLASDAWPPPEVRYESWYLSATPSGSVTSLNDGSLGTAVAEGATSYRYPDPEWTLGPVVFTRFGADAVRRVLTFTSEPLSNELTVAGPAELVLHLSSSRTDTDVIVKLSEQVPQSDEARSTGAQPASTVVTKGWLRASHRGSAADERIGSPIMLRADPLPIVPGEIVELRIPLMPTAYRFRAGSRIRLELCNADSPLTDAVFSHPYTPDKVGVDTIHHDAAHPSRLLLPVLP
jgi:putative CocE/NonD family hydrolase